MTVLKIYFSESPLNTYEVTVTSYKCILNKSILSVSMMKYLVSLKQYVKCRLLQKSATLKVKKQQTLDSGGKADQEELFAYL